MRRVVGAAALMTLQGTGWGVEAEKRDAIDPHEIQPEQQFDEVSSSSGATPNHRSQPRDLTSGTSSSSTASTAVHMQKLSSASPSDRSTRVIDLSSGGARDASTTASSSSSSSRRTTDAEQQTLSTLSSSAAARRTEDSTSSGANGELLAASGGEPPSSEKQELSFADRVRRRAESINEKRYGAKSLHLLDDFGMSSARDLQGVQAQYCLVSANGLTQHLRNCLQTCHVIDNVIEPRFSQFEAFCQEAADDPDWPQICFDFNECVLGCTISKEITKGKTLNLIKDGERQDYISRVDPGNVEAEQKCDIEKCRSYCVRQRLNTCHEIGYTAACTAGQRGQYLPCNVDCSSAVRLQRLALLLPLGFFYLVLGVFF
ncbi:unnamed protein product [Amoebophrya sp. A25]|nr:unnamed protein product [Amoebophrya sp. A25]|eukprot:GSA25T00012280001.1